MAGPTTTAPEGGGLSANQVQLLAKLSSGIAQATGLPPLVAKLAQGLSWLLEFDQLALALRGADGRTWALLRPRLAGAGDPDWIELSDPESALEDAITHDRPVKLDRAGSHLLPPGRESTGPIVELSTFPSALCVPIRGPDGPLGALGVFSARGEAYGVGDLHVLQVVTLLVEATARKLVLIDELARMQDELRRVEKLRGELTQLLVHDLKNPLTVLDSGLDFLQSALLPPEAVEAKELIEELRTSSRDLGDMVVTLLDIARIEDGELALKRENVAVEKWLHDRVAQKTPAARAANVKLLSRCEPARAAFSFDPQLMGRVVDNLVINALRYTPKRGQVAVVGRIADGQLTLAVGDTGPGVPADQRDRLFTKYGQLVGDPNETLTRGSRGLGLYFCKLVVDLHGGRIGVESFPGGGALFRISLPV